MGKIDLKTTQLLDALDRLEESVVDFEKIKEKTEKNSNEDERLYRTYRDSMIQRFKLCADLFWKYLKRYLVEELQQKIDINAPKPVIRTACKAKLLSEEDAESAIKMIKYRNMSSHIYKEEMADRIASKISGYLSLMNRSARR
jgi:nucleotidyltransferase substrate binding protein (TIGR01987 family)